MSLSQSTLYQNPIISHDGLINEKIITENGDQLRDFFKNDTFLSRKIFSIYMELIQNMFYYSCEKKEVNGKAYGVGKINVIREGNYYVITSCNVAENKFVENISKKYPIINKLNKEELRKLKIKTRRDPQGPLSKGAGIGLIQMAILSANPLNIYFEKINKTHSYYYIQVTIEANH